MSNDSGHLPADATHQALQAGARMTGIGHIRLGIAGGRIRLGITSDYLILSFRSYVDIMSLYAAFLITVKIGNFETSFKN